MTVLDPALFAHGRVLRRFHGSDAARFSPRLAHGLLARIAREADAPPVLWDPLCGAALIPCVAALFFPDAFRAVVASDLAPAAVACARDNLALVTRREAALRRIREARGHARRNAKSARRWTAVADYLTALLPAIDAATTPALALRASAFAPPVDPALPLHLVADLPYGRASDLIGGDTADLVDALRRACPRASMTLVTTAEDAATLRLPCDTAPLRAGRVVVRVHEPRTP